MSPLPSVSNLSKIFLALAVRIVNNFTSINHQLTLTVSRAGRLLLFLGGKLLLWIVETLVVGLKVGNWLLGFHVVVEERARRSNLFKWVEPNNSARQAQFMLSVCWRRETPLEDAKGWDKLLHCINTSRRTHWIWLNTNFDFLRIEKELFFLRRKKRENKYEVALLSCCLPPFLFHFLFAVPFFCLFFLITLTDGWACVACLRCCVLLRELREVIIRHFKHLVP